MSTGDKPDRIKPPFELLPLTNPKPQQRAKTTRFTNITQRLFDTPKPDAKELIARQVDQRNSLANRMKPKPLFKQETDK